MAEQSKHTPGPLTVRGPSPGGGSMDDGGDYAILNERGHIVGEAYRKVGRNNFGVTFEADAEANARLWAAAPDLLAVCEALVSDLTADDRANMGDAYDAICAAIAKARGGAQ